MVNIKIYYSQHLFVVMNLSERLTNQSTTKLNILCARTHLKARANPSIYITWAFKQ